MKRPCRDFWIARKTMAVLLPAVLLDQLYAEPARAYLEAHGSTVRTNAPASVFVEGDKAAGIRVRDGIERAATVISTVPWFNLRALFSTVPSDIAPIVASAEALPASPIVTVNLWLASGALPERLIGLPGCHFQWAFDRRAIAGSAHAAALRRRLEHDPTITVFSEAESLDALRGEGPADLMEVTLELGAELLKLSGQAPSLAAGRERLVEAVSSGAGLEKFREMVVAQRGDLDAPRPVAPASLPAMTLTLSSLRIRRMTTAPPVPAR